MLLTESQQNHLDVVNANLNESNENHDSFMTSIESLINDGVDVQQALLEVYGTVLE